MSAVARKTRVTPEEANGMVAAYNAGATMREIADIFNRPISCVSRHLHQKRAHIRPTGRRMDCDKAARAWAIRKAGATYRQLAEQMRLSVARVHMLAQKGRALEVIKL